MSEQRTSNKTNRADEAGLPETGGGPFHSRANPPSERFAAQGTDAPLSLVTVTKRGSHTPRDPASLRAAEEALLRLARAMARAAARDQVALESSSTKEEIKNADED